MTKSLGDLRRSETLRRARSSSLGSRPPLHGRMCFRMTIPDWMALRRNCRIDLATRNSRPIRPLWHDQKKREEEAPRSRRLNELAAGLTGKRLASSRPTWSHQAYSSGQDIGVTRTPHPQLFAVHWHHEFDRIVERSA